MRIAFVFPGQGSHRPGTVPAFAGHPAAGLLAALSTSTGLDLPTILEDPATATRTAAAQPAILAASLLALDALRRHDVHADVVAGHSLGEVTAAVAAGALDVAAAGRVVAARGRAMADACAASPGGMLALLRLAPEAVEVLVDDDDDLVVANDNAPGQVVVAGSPAALDRVRTRAQDAGGRVLPLAVEGAFHSPAMAPAVPALAEALDAEVLREAHTPVLSGADVVARTAGQELGDALVRGLLAPVRWREVQLALADDGVTDLIEVGPGGVLAGLARRTVADLRIHRVATPQDAAEVAEALGRRVRHAA